MAARLSGLIGRLRSSQQARRRGQALAVVAITMTALIGFVALAVDAGFLYQETRKAQTIADSAALAAATHIWKSSSGCENPATFAAAESVAAKYVSANGYDPSVDPTIGIAVTCPYSGNNKSVRVQVSRRVNAFFSGPVFGSLFSPNVAAVGTVTKVEGPAPFMALGTSCTTPGIYAQGSASLEIAGGGIISNSCATNAVDTLGSARISSVTGTITTVGGCDAGDRISPPCTTGAAPQPDPLASSLTQYPCNPLSSCPDYTCARGSICSGTYSSTSTYSWGGNRTEVIGPGVYYGISPGNGKLYLRPGVYVIRGGDFAWAGNADLKVCKGLPGEPVVGDALRGAALGCTGVTGANAGVLIYSTPLGFPTNWPTCPPTAPQNTAGVLDLTGNGTLDLLPMPSGPWAGLTIWQDACNSREMSLGGTSAAIGIGGTVYVPSAQVNLQGNAGFFSTGAFYANNFRIQGSSQISITYSGGGNYLPEIATLSE